jgi:predicted transcriptional regulator
LVDYLSFTYIIEECDIELLEWMLLSAYPINWFDISEDIEPSKLELIHEYFS